MDVSFAVEVEEEDESESDWVNPQVNSYCKHHSGQEEIYVTFAVSMVSYDAHIFIMLLVNIVYSLVMLVVELFCSNGISKNVFFKKM